ncbi:expressed unknown protein [Seminavis robusta]|uniref:Uncharacterized protein n=1 Tax=Seminavis robusta TaxID=568900 RepID=A0A9N8E2M7_9STRA|nr:expressed unknown protein [Seminavis robusta]|eukprot:Sro483_g151960.1 n/a (172) ;mRNA; f:2184-2699
MDTTQDLHVRRHKYVNPHKNNAAISDDHEGYANLLAFIKHAVGSNCKLEMFTINLGIHILRHHLKKEFSTDKSCNLENQQFYCSALVAQGLHLGIMKQEINPDELMPNSYALPSHHARSFSRVLQPGQSYSEPQVLVQKGNHLASVVELSCFATVSLAASSLAFQLLLSAS